MSQILAASAALSLAVLLAPSAQAITAMTAPGIQNSIAATSMVESVVRVCQHDFWTSRRRCWIDRSRPPTVCHWVRDSSGRMVRDCY